MSRPSPDPLDRLQSAFREMKATLGHLRSLAPGREEATPLPELGEQLLAGVDAEIADAFSISLAAIARAQIDSFPTNLFWDLDYPAARLLAAARAPDPLEALERAAARIVELDRIFGVRSKIQFRYAHDFIYGFDWARWVPAEEGRAEVGPFDEPFLAYMTRRGGEILDLIAKNDAKYPELPRGVARNPFGFSREPEDEARLHHDLAERGLIPVEAWRIDAEPTWNRSFARLREERAHALGLWRGRT